MNKPYRPGACCERCVFGRGQHARWCESLAVKISKILARDGVTVYPEDGEPYHSSDDKAFMNPVGTYEFTTDWDWDRLLAIADRRNRR